MHSSKNSIIDRNNHLIMAVIGGGACIPIMPKKSKNGAVTINIVRNFQRLSL